MFVTFFVNLLAKIALFFYAIVARIRQSSSLFYLQVLTGIACAGLLLVVLQNTIMWRLNYVTLQIPEMLQSLDVYDQFSEVEKAQMPNQNGEILSKNINKIWTVVNGDNFINILARLNIGTSEIQKILKQINKEKQIARLSLGQQISVTADCTIKYHQENANTSTSGSYLPLKMRPSAACSLVKLQMQTKDDRRIVITKNANEFTTHITAISTSSKNKVIKGVISSSLYGDASKAGVPAALMAQVLTQYSFDIDFQRDIHQNDEFAFVFEEIVDENGNKIRNGKLLFSELILSGKSYKLYNFHNDFYNILAFHI